MLSQQDTQIIEGIRSGNEKYLRLFYDTYKQPLLKYIAKQLDYEVAEEVLQDSFIDCIESLRNFQGNSSLKTYLFSIAKYKIIDKIRKKKIKKIFFSYLPSNIVESLGKVFLDDSIDSKLLASKIKTVLKRLPNDYALVLRLKYEEGYKVAKIAQEIKMSFKATESLIYRARLAFIKEYGNSERQSLLTFKEGI